MNLKPLSDNVVIEPIKSPNVSSGGVILPEYCDTEPLAKGKVIAVGPGLVGPNGIVYPMNVKVGDEVLISSYAPSTYQGFVIVCQSSIYAIVVD